MTELQTILINAIRDTDGTTTSIMEETGLTKNDIREIAKGLLKKGILKSKIIQPERVIVKKKHKVLKYKIVDKNIPI